MSGADKQPFDRHPIDWGGAWGAMRVRFRVRTSAGHELSFASKDTFEEFVRSGDLSLDDLVYDAEDGSWAPARTHPIVLAIQYEEEEEAAPGGDRAQGPDEAADPGSGAASAGGKSRGDAPTREADKPVGLSLAPPRKTTESDPSGTLDADPAAADGSATPASDELGLDLVLTDEVSAEEDKRAFLEKLKAERASESDGGLTRSEGFQGFRIDSGSFTEMLKKGPTVDEPATPKPSTEPPRAPTRPSTPSAPTRRPPTPRAPTGRPPIARPPTSDSAASRPSRSKPRKKAGFGRLFFGLVLLAAFGWIGYAAFGVLAVPPEVTIDRSGTSDDPADPVDPIDVGSPRPDPVREPVIANTVAAVRERAQERYLSSTQALLRDLRPIPDIWPEGQYLALPTDHPEIVDVWQSYIATIRAVRASDTERYRTAYEAALDDAVVEGEARETWLATAMSAFVATSPLREAHFDRVENLATAAIQSHNALVEAEGLILYDPTGSTGRAAAIGQGMSGRDADSQLLLDQVVDLLERRLDADGAGPGDGPSVREWVWDGFLDAATR